MGKKIESFHYKNKTIRIADATWEKLKNKRRKSGKTWNIFILSLIQSNKKFSTEKTLVVEGIPAATEKNE